MVRSKVTAQTTRNPLISVQHFLVLSILRFKLSESFRNRFRSNLLDQEMNFKKNLSKIFHFSWRNFTFSKKVENIFDEFRYENHSNPISGFPMHTVERAEITLFRTYQKCLPGQKTRLPGPDVPVNLTNRKIRFFTSKLCPKKSQL